MPVKGTMGGNAQDREDYVDVAASISRHEANMICRSVQVRPHGSGALSLRNDQRCT